MMSSSKVSKALAVLFTICVTIFLVLVIKRKNKDERVVIFSFGEDIIDDPSYVHPIDEPQVVLLKTIQVVKKNDGGLLETVHVEYPKTDRNFIITLVRVLNFNGKYQDANLESDGDFDASISDGDIGTNAATVEIKSKRNIDADVEFYGYEEEEEEEHEDEDDSIEL